MSYILSGEAVSIVIITNFLFKHWFDTTSHIVNLVKLIVNIMSGKTSIPGIVVPSLIGRKTTYSG